MAFQWKYKTNSILFQKVDQKLFSNIFFNFSLLIWEGGSNKKELKKKRETEAFNLKFHVKTAAN